MIPPDSRQINEEPAGPLMDAWVAYFVLGWGGMSFDRERAVWIGSPPKSTRRPVPPYSGDMGPCWEMLTRLMFVSDWGCHSLGACHDDRDWGVMLCRQSKHDNIEHWTHARAVDAPLALCRAALMTVLG